MTPANDEAPKILDIPIGLRATGKRQEFDSLGKVEVPADHYLGGSDPAQPGALQYRPRPHAERGVPRLRICEKGGRPCQHRGRAPSGLEGPAHRASVRRCHQRTAGLRAPPLCLADGVTQSNMNVNEVISNRCIQLVGGTLGSQEPVHPNDHVNMGQSSNDTFPTAMHIAAYTMATGKTVPALKRLRDAIDAKSKEWADVVKIGRTHLEDADPLIVGQEWLGYAGGLDDAVAEAEHVTSGLLVLAMGGTAVGTGLNAPAGFGDQVAAEIAKMTGAPYVTAANKFIAQGTLDRMVRAHGGLKAAAVSLYKIAENRAGSARVPAPASTSSSSRPTSRVARLCRAKATRPRPRPC
jgi:fumarate hydratase, class II